MSCRLSGVNSRYENHKHNLKVQKALEIHFLVIFKTGRDSYISRKVGIHSCFFSRVHSLSP